MGCANGKVSPTGGEVMLRADGTVRTLTDEQSKAQMLKAQESAKRLAEMMAELGLQEGGDYKLIGDTALVAALQRQWYGATLDLSGDLITPYLQATLMVAAADGLAAEEATWLRARTLLLGLTPAQANQLMQYDTSFQNLEPVLKKLREGSSATGLIGRYIFYDGLTMAAQDGISLDERVRAGRAAEILGLSEGESEEVKEVVEAEEMLRQRKAALFLPDEEEDEEGVQAPSPPPTRTDKQQQEQRRSAMQ